MARSGWLLVLALAWGLPAQAQSPQAPTHPDCVASGQVIILGTSAQREGDAIAYFVSLTNPTMRPVLVEPRFDGTVQPVVRIEAGRMQRLRLGRGEAMRSAAEIAEALRLRCRPA